jgi:hypothetical protein
MEALLLDLRKIEVSWNRIVAHRKPLCLLSSARLIIEGCRKECHMSSKSHLSAANILTWIVSFVVCLGTLVVMVLVTINSPVVSGYEAPPMPSSTDMSAQDRAALVDATISQAGVSSVVRFPTMNVSFVPTKASGDKRPSPVGNMPKGTAYAVTSFPVGAQFEVSFPISQKTRMAHVGAEISGGQVMIGIQLGEKVEIVASGYAAVGETRTVMSPQAVSLPYDSVILTYEFTPLKNGVSWIRGMWQPVGADSATPLPGDE